MAMIKCEKCGAWHRASETCICSAQAVKSPEPVKNEKEACRSVGSGRLLLVKCGAAFVDFDRRKAVLTLTIVHKCDKITMEYCAQTEKLCLRRCSPVSALR